MTIKITTLIDSPFGVASDDGKHLFSVLDKELSNGTKVDLDFDGIEVLTSSFLNESIGSLYSSKVSYKADDLVSYTNVTEDDQETINTVIDNAKKYFADRSPK